MIGYKDYTNEDVVEDKKTQNLEKNNITTSEDLERDLFNTTLEIELMEKELYNNIVKFHGYKNKLGEKDVANQDLKDKEKQKKELNKLKRKEDYYIKKFQHYYYHDDGVPTNAIVIEFFKNIDDNEIKLFEFLLLNIEKKDIYSLENNNWEILKLEVREQIIDLLKKIIADKKNPHNEIWSQYFELEEIEERLFNSVRYRIKEKLELLTRNLSLMKNENTDECLKCLSDVEKNLKNASNVLIKYNEKNESQVLSIENLIDRHLHKKFLDME